MEPSRFKVVFEKVAEALSSDAPLGADSTTIAYAELDEISELRRLAEELSEPESQQYTLT